MSSKDHKDLFKTEEKIDDDGNQQFNLYTEKIVEKPSVKYRKSKVEKSTKICMFFALKQISKSLQKAKSVEPNNTNQNNFFVK